MSWQVDDFERSRSDVATWTIIAYRRDVDAFAGWAPRAQLSGPAQVTGLLLRRYLGFLATRRYARRTALARSRPSGATLTTVRTRCRRRGLEAPPSHRLGQGRQEEAGPDQRAGVGGCVSLDVA